MRQKLLAWSLIAVQPTLKSWGLPLALVSCYYVTIHARKRPFSSANFESYYYVRKLPFLLDAPTYTLTTGIIQEAHTVPVSMEYL